MSYPYQTDHTSGMFWDIVNEIELNYAQFKALKPETSFPSDWRDGGIDQTIDEEPQYANIRRLFYGEYPSTIYMYQTAILGDTSFNAVTERYERVWTLENKDSNAMVAVNETVEQIASARRDQVRAEESIENDGFYFNATDQTINATISLREFLKNKGEGATVTWVGTKDPITKMPRNKLATDADLQTINIMAEAMRQFGIDAYVATVDEQVNNAAVDVTTTFADYAAVTAFFDDVYDGLKNPE